MAEPDELERLLRELRDADAYIKLLEHECDSWKQQYYDLLRMDSEGGAT